MARASVGTRLPRGLLAFTLCAGCGDASYRVELTIDGPEALTEPVESIALRIDDDPAQPFDRGSKRFPLTIGIALSSPWKSIDMGQIRLVVDALDAQSSTIARAAATASLDSYDIIRVSALLGPPCDADADCESEHYCDEVRSCTDRVCGTPKQPCSASTISCVSVTCNEAERRCDVLPIHAKCPAFDLGNGQTEPTYCDAALGCVPGKACGGDAVCQDAFVCNGSETCLSGRCIPGQPPEQDDRKPCTRDSCSEAEKRVVHTAFEGVVQCSTATVARGICVGMECRVSICGDGITDTWVAREDCDDADDNPYDGCDACHLAPLDTDEDGIPDAVEGAVDSDGDLIANFQDPDSDNDRILDAIEGAGDFDADGLPNYLDLDSDGDGLPDRVEGTADPDGDGAPNFLDLDFNGDGVADEVALAFDLRGPDVFQATLLAASGSPSFDWVFYSATSSIASSSVAGRNGQAVEYAIPDGETTVVVVPGSLRSLIQNFSANGQTIARFPPSVTALPALETLDLSQNGISGTLPASLENLQNLERLYLNGNALTGAIPAELGSLGKLAVLHLASNQLEGPIPAEFGNLGSLTHLLLHRNQLSGTIPRELGNPTHLRSLWLYENELTGTIPSALGNLGALEILTLYGNDLEGNIPPELGRLTNLTTLMLDHNHLTGAIPSELGGLDSLETLDLSENELSGEIPAALGDLTQLRTLRLTRNALSGPIPTQFGNLALLETLRFGENNLSGTIPPELGRLTNLATLYAPANALAGEIPSQLGALEKLTELSLNSNQLSGPIPAALGSLPALVTLRLSGNRLTGEIPAALGDLSNLGTLWLYDNQLTGAIPSAIGGLTKLTWLELGGNGLSGAIPAELGACTRLEVLNLNYNRLSGILGRPFSSLVAIQDLRVDNNRLSTAVVDAIIDQIWTARDAYTFPSPSLQIGGNNSAPSATGKAQIADLVNGVKGERFPRWTISFTP